MRPSRARPGLLELLNLAFFSNEIIKIIKNQHKNKNTMITKPYISPRSNRNYGRNQNIAIYQSTIKLGPVSNAVMLGISLAALGLLYLTQVTKTTGYDYEINKVEVAISELSNKKTDLEIEKARLTALATTEQTAVAKAMSEPSQVTYVSN